MTAAAALTIVAGAALMKSRQLVAVRFTRGCLPLQPFLPLVAVGML